MGRTRTGNANPKEALELIQELQREKVNRGKAVDTQASKNTRGKSQTPPPSPSTKKTPDRSPARKSTPPASPGKPKTPRASPGISTNYASSPSKPAETTKSLNGIDATPEPDPPGKLTYTYAVCNPSLYPLHDHSL